MKKILGLILLMLCLLTAKGAVAAGPLLKFNPNSGTYTNGGTFTVKIGVDSDIEQTMAIDVWSTFDATKLEIVSIVKSPTLADNYGLSADAANIDNANGKFSMSFYSSGGSAAFEAKTVSGDLATITFKAKAIGTANVNFTCAAGSSIDSNIFNVSTVDVINCGSNINGVYTITDGGGGTTADPTATPVVSTSTAGDEQLPQTGSVGATIGLLIFGIVGVLSSLALRFL